MKRLLIIIILSAVGYIGYTKFQQQKALIESNKELEAKITLIENDINKFVTEEKSCQQTFNKVDFAKEKIPIKYIKDETGKTLFEAGESYEKDIKLVNISLSDFIYSSEEESEGDIPEKGVAKLVVTFEKLGKFIGDKTKTKSFNIELYIDKDYVIRGCSELFVEQPEPMVEAIVDSPKDEIEKAVLKVITNKEEEIVETRKTQKRGEVKPRKAKWPPTLDDNVPEVNNEPPPYAKDITVIENPFASPPDYAPAESADN